jgi:hypothetical protein
MNQFPNFFLINSNKMDRTSILCVKLIRNHLDIYCSRCFCESFMVDTVGPGGGGGLLWGQGLEIGDSDTDTLHGHRHEHSAWIWIYRTYMGIAAWTWTRSMDMNMQHRHIQAAWVWTSSIDMAMRRAGHNRWQFNELIMILLIDIVDSRLLMDLRNRVIGLSLQN